LLIQWLSPTGSEKAQPTSAFWAEVKQGSPPPPSFTGVDPSADFGQPAVTHRRRWCRGGTLDQAEPVGGGRVEGGSPRRAGDGKGVDSDVDDGDSSDKMLPMRKVWM
jgi:hypothetical protein